MIPSPSPLSPPMPDTRCAKVKPNPEVTRLSLPGRSASDWWAQPRAPAIPPHLRSKTSLPSQSSISAFQALFGGSVTVDDPEEDPYEEAVDDDQDIMSSSPAAVFLSGMHSPSSADTNHRGSMSMSFSSAVRPIVQPPQDEIVAGYRLGEVIGRGGFSVVRKGTSVNTDSSAPVTVTAVKIIKKDDSRAGAEEARVRLANESKIWSGLSHEHILPLFQTVDSPDATYLIMLYCPAGSLLDVINAHKADGLEGVGMDDAGMLFRQVVRGLKYLHEVVGLVHGDLKLENVLVDDLGSCRIADFGLARFMHDDESDGSDGGASASRSGSTEAHKGSSTLSIHNSLKGRGRTGRLPSRLSKSMNVTTVEEIRPTETTSQRPQYYFPPGSLQYASPELLTPQKTSRIPPPDPAQDIWALGCVLYALLFGVLPFNDSFEPRLQMKILNGTWKLPDNYRTSLPSPSSGGHGLHLRNRSRSTSRTRSGSRSRHAKGTRAASRNRSSSRRMKSPTYANAGASGFLSNMPLSTTTSARPSRSKSRSRAEPQKTIGRVAENVLHGCLCVDVHERWTVSMIDEVGWGVGWDLDVDEAGEEFDEPEDFDAEAGALSASSSASTESSIDRDHYGNRFYVPTTQLSPVLSDGSGAGGVEMNKLYAETLNLVTSPSSGIRSTASELEALAISHSDSAAPTASKSLSSRVTTVPPPPATSSSTKMETSSSAENTCDEGGAMEKRSRSRGKRGKASRSSSRAAPAPMTPSPPAPDADPFQAFREGYVPPSLIPLLPGSRPSSRVGSRAPSKERERERERDWPRGRPTTNNAHASSWRVTGGSSGGNAASAAAGLPTIDASGQSYEPESFIDAAWRQQHHRAVGGSSSLSTESSHSPSASPLPITPMYLSAVHSTEPVECGDGGKGLGPARGRGDAAEHDRDTKPTRSAGYHSRQSSRSGFVAGGSLDRGRTSPHVSWS